MIICIKKLLFAMAQSFHCFTKKNNIMKRLIITAVLLVSLQSAFSQTLLDSLQGKWTVTGITNNKKNSMKDGTLYFSEDGKFISAGNHFGSTQALYTTNETTASVQIEAANKSVTEWGVVVKMGVLYLTSVDSSNKGKQPVIKITAIRTKN
jgi:hypothetical protein